MHLTYMRQWYSFRELHKKSRICPVPVSELYHRNFASYDRRTGPQNAWNEKIYFNFSKLPTQYKLRYFVYIRNSRLNLVVIYIYTDL